jgi:hypothetical protein
MNTTATSSVGNAAPMSREPTADAALGIHYSELGPLAPGDVFFDEWNTYLQEVGRLLAGGQAGRFMLIKGKQLLSVFETWDAARTAGLRQFLREPFFVHEVREIEPHLRIRGVNWPCRSRP